MISFRNDGLNLQNGINASALNYMYNFQMFFCVGNKIKFFCTFAISGDTIDGKLNLKAICCSLAQEAAFFAFL
jgi:hypothetical protein